jgi:tetratricopeptide (TPR) repeat protein
LTLSFIPATREGRLNALIGLLVFLFTFSVYAYCVTPTVPYWDSGEFIATSYILGVPHPPGTPLYVLIGRLFSMIPFSSIAVRVNILSSFSSALAVLFTYLITVRIVRKNFMSEVTGSPWLAWVGGVVAAFFMAFSTTFWDNAIEAEVYGPASAIMTLCVWLGLYWWDRQEEQQNDRIIWLILYILFLAVGIHMGTFLVFPCIYLLVTMVHWERVKKGAFWGSIALFSIVFLIRYFLINTINDQNPNIVDLSMAESAIRGQASFLFLVMAIAVLWNIISVLGLRFALGIFGLAVLGISVHFYLLIRSNLDPAINEGDPSTWEALKLLLLRDQYKPPEPNFRKAALWFQFDTMYLRYFSWQYHLGEFLGGRTWLIPAGIGIFGAMINAMREKKSFFLMFTLYLITGPFMVYYLNFKEGEVRERDYFFVANFHFFAIWIGFGCAALIQSISELMAREPEGEARKLHPVALPLALVLVVMSAMPLAAGQGNNNFFRHNRRGNFIAHNYAYNMLVGLEKDAVIFTNGDNDTFPLWYIQEVEGFRKDVRVLCLSLLNTDWCIRQARDLPPKVPIDLTDADIAGMQPYRDRATGQVVFVKDMMVKHIIETNNWQRPIYLAVTVPEHMGLDSQLEMQGLVYRIRKDPVTSPLNAEITRVNLNEKYRYEGFLTKDGKWDESVYKDDQSTKLLQNYAAAYIQLAVELGEQGKTEEAIAEMKKVDEMSKHMPGIRLAMGMVYERMNRLDDAERHFLDMQKEYADDPQVLSRLGHVQALKGDTAAAIPVLRRSIELDPRNEFNPYAELVNIYFKSGEYSSCIALLEQWLSFHPDDARARESLTMIRGVAGS